MVPVLRGRPSSSGSSSPGRSGRPRPPPTDGRDATTAHGGAARRLRLRPRRLPAPGRRRSRRRTVGARRGADRLGQDRRRRVRRRRRPRPWTPGVLHHPDQGAVEPEVRRPASAPRIGPRRPADRRQHHRRRCARRGDDHRGPAQHDLRGQAARRSRASSCSTRSTTSRTRSAARCGRRSSSTCPNTCSSCASRRRCRTPTTSATGSPRCADRPTSSSRTNGRSSSRTRTWSATSRTTDSTSSTR